MKAVKQIGLRQANMKLLKTQAEKKEKEEVKNIKDNNDGLFNPECINQAKEDALKRCKNEEQRSWLLNVMSYLIVYYNAHDDRTERKDVKTICASNPPIVTVAPAGCGKSWLAMQLSDFLQVAIPTECLPITSQDDSLIDICIEQDKKSGVKETVELGFAKFGCVAVFASSGVAAGNAHGFTFNNGLKKARINAKALEQEPSSSTIATLQSEFRNARAILVDEGFYAPIFHFAYLDKLLRRMRPSFAEIPYAAYPLIVIGDPMQLPPVNAMSILSEERKIPRSLQSIATHLTENVFFMKLEKSIRQGKDQEYAKILNRIRLATASEDDMFKHEQAIERRSWLAKSSRSYCDKC